jgi:hypothetical protein
MQMADWFLDYLTTLFPLQWSYIIVSREGLYQFPLWNETLEMQLAKLLVFSLSILFHLRSFVSIFPFHCSCKTHEH